MDTPKEPLPLPASVLFAVEQELAKYVGTPKCMDCKWKLGSDITDNCGCTGGAADHEKYKKAFDRARYLQGVLAANAQDDSQSPAKNL